MGFFSKLFGPKEAPAPAAQPFPAESLPADGRSDDRQVLSLPL